MTFDYIHIFKLLRAIISGLFLMIFCFFLMKRGVSKEGLIEIYIWAVILHSAIVIAQNINPQTGLTQTESALLSPGEQLIKQRLRT